MRVGTRLVSCRFFAQTNRLELGWLIVGQVREGTEGSEFISKSNSSLMNAVSLRPSSVATNVPITDLYAV